MIFKMAASTSRPENLSCPRCWSLRVSKGGLSGIGVRGVLDNCAALDPLSPRNPCAPALAPIGTGTDASPLPLLGVPMGVAVDDRELMVVCIMK